MAKRRFKDEIVKRFLSKSIASIIYMIENSYLNIFNEEELEVILNKFNFKKLEKSQKLKLKIKLRCLRELAKTKNKLAESSYKGFVIQNLREGKNLNLENLLYFDHLDCLKNHELVRILNKLKKKNLLKKLELEELLITSEKIHEA